LGNDGYFPEVTIDSYCSVNALYEFRHSIERIMLIKDWLFYDAELV
jgi:hypothetical protein